jgi:hypothetical protein
MRWRYLLVILKGQCCAMPQKDTGGHHGLSCPTHRDSTSELKSKIGSGCGQGDTRKRACLPSEEEDRDSRYTYCQDSQKLAEEVTQTTLKMSRAGTNFPRVNTGIKFAQ